MYLRGFIVQVQRSLFSSTNEQNKFYDQLLQATGFDKDPRVKFVGTVHDRERA